MNIEKAISLLREKYEKAQRMDFVHNPLAYALYHTWREVEGSPDRPKPPTDLTGKCGSCMYAEPTTAFGSSKCYIECKHPNRRYRGGTAHLKQRTMKACKKYRPRVIDCATIQKGAAE